MVPRLATVEAPYRYGMSGLKNVVLCGIDVHRCGKCKVESPVLFRIPELHRVIARELVRKPSPLRGDELRFLRKHAGIPAVKFAALLGINPAYLSRVENGHHGALGRSADRLARALTMAVSEEEAVREVLLQMAGDLETRRSSKRSGRALFKLIRNHWRAAA
jgi:transcriptional regulator with XRE-family HTH domain